MEIRLTDLSLHLDGKRLLEDVSLTIRAGDFAIIQGASGSGKTSFLRLLNRLNEPTSGKILVDGKAIRALPVTTLRRKIAYLQQTPVVTNGTVRDNLVLGQRYKAAGGSAPLDDDALREKMSAFLLEDVGLDDDATKLSIGQRQRIALIRTLLMEPEVLLCDEPTSALDPDSRQVVEEHLERLNIEEGITIILVTHVYAETSRVTPRRITLAATQLVEDKS